MLLVRLREGTWYGVGMAFDHWNLETANYCTLLQFFCPPSVFRLKLIHNLPHIGNRSSDLCDFVTLRLWAYFAL